MWKVGQAFQENRVCYVQVEEMWIELVQLQDSQVCFQIVGVATGLFLNVFLEDWQMIWIVSGQHIKSFRLGGFLVVLFPTFNTCMLEYGEG